MAENVSIVTLPGHQIADPASTRAPIPQVEIGKISVEPQQLEKKFDVKDMKELTKHLNEVMAAFDVQARFFVHQQTKDIVVQVINSRTNQLIREVPSVKMLDMVAKFIDLLGLMVDEKA